MTETKSEIQRFQERYHLDSIVDLGVQRWRNGQFYFTTEFTMRLADGKPFRFYSRCPIEIRKKNSWTAANSLRWDVDSAVVGAVHDALRGEK